MLIKDVAVIGAGTMGNGIAQVAAQAGFNVRLYDQRKISLTKGLEQIKGGVARIAEKSNYAQAKVEKIVDRVKLTSNMNELADVDIVFEAIDENLASKEKLFSKLNEICKPETLFISNTSGLSITAISESSGRKDRVVCMHFFNPVPVMPLVEIVRAANTSDETYDTALKLAESFNKKAFTVKESPLFVFNRILIPMVNEAIFVLEENLTTAEDIDEIMRLAAGHPIGPLALADLIGLDVTLDVMETLYDETADSKYRPAPLLKYMVRANKLGRKTKEGFFKYD